MFPCSYLFRGCHGRVWSPHLRTVRTGSPRQLRSAGACQGRETSGDFLIWDVPFKEVAALSAQATRVRIQERGKPEMAVESLPDSFLTKQRETKQATQKIVSSRDFWTDSICI